MPARGDGGPETFGALVREWRGERNWSSHEAASAIATQLGRTSTWDHLRTLEIGEALPSPSMLQAICAVYRNEDIYEDARVWLAPSVNHSDPRVVLEALRPEHSINWEKHPARAVLDSSSYPSGVQSFLDPTFDATARSTLRVRARS